MSKRIFGPQSGLLADKYMNKKQKDVFIPSPRLFYKLVALGGVKRNKCLSFGRTKTAQSYVGTKT
jgi:hypothetical protein